MFRKNSCKTGWSWHLLFSFKSPAELCGFFSSACFFKSACYPSVALVCIIYSFVSAFLFPIGNVYKIIKILKCQMSVPPSFHFHPMSGSLHSQYYLCCPKKGAPALIASRKLHSLIRIFFFFTGTIPWLWLILEVGNISLGHKTSWND